MNKIKTKQDAKELLMKMPVGSRFTFITRIEIVGGDTTTIKRTKENKWEAKNSGNNWEDRRPTFYGENGDLSLEELVLDIYRNRKHINRKLSIIGIDFIEYH